MTYMDKESWDVMVKQTQDIIKMARMKEKKLHNLKKQELVEMLEKRNYQYGEVCNKYAELKKKYRKLLTKKGEKALGRLRGRGY